MVHQYAARTSYEHSSKATDPLSRRNEYSRYVFTERPWFGPLLFDNNASDARDHCAAERSMWSLLFARNLS